MNRRVGLNLYSSQTEQDIAVGLQNTTKRAIT